MVGYGGRSLSTVNNSRIKDVDVYGGVRGSGCFGGRALSFTGFQGEGSPCWWCSGSSSSVWNELQQVLPLQHLSFRQSKGMPTTDVVSGSSSEVTAVTGAVSGSISLAVFSVGIPLAGSIPRSEEKEAAREGALGQTDNIAKSFKEVIVDTGKASLRPKFRLISRPRVRRVSYIIQART